MGNDWYARYIVRDVNESCLDMLVRVFQVLTRDQCAMFGMINGCGIEQMGLLLGFNLQL